MAAARSESLSDSNRSRLPEDGLRPSLWTLPTSSSKMSLASDSTSLGYGSWREETLSSSNVSADDDLYNVSNSSWSLGRLASSSPRQCSFRLSEALIDSFYRNNAEFYDLDSVDLSCEYDSGTEEDASGDALDEVQPSPDLARKDMTEMASCVLSMIASLQHSILSDRHDSQVPSESPRSRPTPLKAIPESAVVDHIYEEIPDDSGEVDLNCLKPPPLPCRNPLERRKSLESFFSGLRRRSQRLSFDSAGRTRRKKLPSLHQISSPDKKGDRSFCGWADERAVFRRAPSCASPSQSSPQSSTRL